MDPNSDDTLPAEPTDPHAETETGSERALPDTGAGPRTIGRFEVVERLGAGGLGVVYTGQDPELKRRVAIKLLKPRPGGGSAGDARLLREAQAMAQLSHPNVVPVFEVGRHQGAVYVAMEFVDGATLRVWQRDRTPKEIIAAYVEAGRGLAAAHLAGIVHRDFKPDNVMVGADDRPRVLDFGLAAADEAAASEADATWSATTSMATLTKTGAVLGTPGYMAPEQFAGQTTDARTDQFAFCVALFEALHGERPFRGATLASLAAAVEGGEISEPRESAEIPAKIADAIRRGLATDPADRFPSMHELLALLRPPSGSRWPVIAAVAGLVGAGVLIVATGDGSDSLGCDGTARKFSAVWTEEASAKLTENAALVAAIDRYAQAWSATEEEFCADASAEGDAAALETAASRRRCLDQSVDHFEATHRRIVPIAFDGTPTATFAVRQLPPVERCLRDPVPTLVAASPADVADVRLEIARSKALGADSNTADALARARHAIERAVSLGDPATLAEARLALYWAQWHAGKHAESLQTAKDAATSASSGGAMYLGAIASAISAMTAAILQQKDSAADWAAQAEAAADRVKGDPRVEGWRLFMRGTMGVVGGEPAQAARDLEAAHAAWVSTYGDDAFELVIALNNLGIARRDSGDIDGAIEAFEAQVRLIERTLGDDAAALRYPLTAMVGVELGRGRADQARDLAERALTVVETHVAPGSVERMSARGRMAEVIEITGPLADAIEHRRHALEEAQAVFGPEHEVTADQLLRLGRLLLALDDAEGEPTLLRARAAREAALPGKKLREDEAYTRTLVALARAAADRDAKDTKSLEQAELALERAATQTGPTLATAGMRPPES